MSMTKLEILDHAFGENGVYSTDVSKRGLADGSFGVCVYVGTNADAEVVHCSVGQWVRPEWVHKLDDLSEFGSGVEEIENTLSREYDLSLDDILLPEVHGHDVMFWCDVQNMHDTGAFWSDNGLNDDGQERLANVRARYASK